MAPAPDLDRPSKSFPREFRLTSRADFSHVFARPRVNQDRCFRVLHRANALPHARLGMAVSARVCKTAVGRNRLKRLVRESFRCHRALVEEHGGFDVVVLPSWHAATICNEELSASLVAHWKKVGLPPREMPAGKNRNRQ